MFIYILKLKNDKWYVGKSNDPEKRFKDHLERKGSEWTRINKPLEIVNMFEMTSPFDEDKTTKELMLEYGINNVRGGSYVQAELPDEQIDNIQRELWMAQDVCVRCGRKGHWVTKCYAKSDINGKHLEKEIPIDYDKIMGLVQTQTTSTQTEPAFDINLYKDLLTVSRDVLSDRYSSNIALVILSTTTLFFMLITITLVLYGYFIWV